MSAQTDSVQQIITPVTSVVEFRVPDKDKIEKYKNDERFHYKKEEKKTSWFTKIKLWLAEAMSRIFSSSVQSGVPGVLVIVILIVLICLLILKFMGVDFRTVLGKKKIDTPEIDIYSENVHEMDFDSLIANALKNKDFRLVIRFLYLKNLKLLSDKEMIEWKANKTNYSYQYEIQNPTIRTQFIETSLIFDYIWYGEFIPTDANFPTIYSRMEAFSKMIANER